MSALPEPYELFEISDKVSISFIPERYEEGTMVIHPRRQPGVSEKVIKALRLTVSKQDKPIGLQYYDITSITLIAQLRPLLDSAIASKRKIKITAFGIAPAKRFTVELV